jgi:hypothetical protein
MLTRTYAAPLIMGAVGGATFGVVLALLVGLSPRSVLMYAIIGVISAALAELAALIDAPKLGRALAFAVTLGTLVSVLGFVLLEQDQSFVQFAIPVFIGALIGGTIYNFLWLIMVERSQQSRSGL